MEQNQKSENRFDVYNYIGIHTRNQNIISQYITGNDVLRFHFHVDQSGDTAVITMPVLKGFSYDTGKVDPCDVDLISLYAALGDFCKKKRAKLKEGEWLFEIPDEPVQQTDNFIHDFEETMPVEFLIRASSDEYLDTSETYAMLTKLYDACCYLEGPQHWQKNHILPIINIDEDTRIVFEYAHGPWTIPFYNLWEKKTVLSLINQAKVLNTLFYSEVPETIKVKLLDLDTPNKKGVVFTTDEVKRAIDRITLPKVSEDNPMCLGRHISSKNQDVSYTKKEDVTHSVHDLIIENNQLFALIGFSALIKSRKVHELYQKGLGKFMLLYGCFPCPGEEFTVVINMEIISVDFLDSGYVEEIQKWETEKLIPDVEILK